MTGSRRHWPQYIGALLIAILMAGTATAFSAISTLDDLVAVDVCATDEAASRPDCLDEPVAPPLPKIPGMSDVEPGKPQTLLLIGSDKRSKKSIDGSQRTGELSDTMMLAHLDGDRGGSLLSIPRDTRVTVGGSTMKINQAYAEGGAPLTVKAIKGLLGVKIHHVVVINFSAFERAVNKLGCFYQDIDRSYFNDNSNGENYAAIDVGAGYQMLCGADTLAWVRYRHADNDLIRAARQQEFLRSVKTQLAASDLVDNRGDLLTIFRRYTRTDIQRGTAILSLLKLAIDASDDPLRSVKFRANDIPGTSDLGVTPAGVATMKREFEQLLPIRGSTTDAGAKNNTTAATPRPTPRPKTPQRKGIATGLTQVGDETSKPELVDASFELASKKLPVYYPSIRLAVGGYAAREPVRTYSIRPSRYSRARYPAFRLTYAAGEGKYFGQYYGVQGTTWKGAPILKEAHETVRRRNRTLNVYSAGGRYRIVSWTTDDAVYWVSNSVSLALGNKQMLDIASSFTRVPG
ncbi:MAG: LCP family protein [Herbiconiux sp.]|nr:LCP family protein [Herbiconiux sp.]